MGNGTMAAAGRASTLLFTLLFIRLEFAFAGFATLKKMKFNFKFKLKIIFCCLFFFMILCVLRTGWYLSWFRTESSVTWF